MAWNIGLSGLKVVTVITVAIHATCVVMISMHFGGQLRLMHTDAAVQIINPCDSFFFFFFFLFFFAIDG